MTTVKKHCRLPLAFIKKPATPLKSKRGYKPCFRALPFVAGWRSKTKTPYWNVPATGGYFGGYETGEAMALAMLKHLRNDNSNLASLACPLPGVVESFMTRFEEEGGSQMLGRSHGEWSESFESFRGQYCGFFNTLAKWFYASARVLGSQLDDVTEHDLIFRANVGLGFDNSAYMEYMSDADPDEEGEEAVNGIASSEEVKHG